MVDLVKAVQEAVDRRKAAAVLRHHPVLAQYVTRDYALQPGVTFPSRLTTNVYTTLGPIRIGRSSVGVTAWCICEHCGEEVKNWVFLDRVAARTTDEEFAWRSVLPKLIQEVETCSP